MARGEGNRDIRQADQCQTIDEAYYEASGKVRGLLLRHAVRRTINRIILKATRSVSSNTRSFLSRNRHSVPIEIASMFLSAGGVATQVVRLSTRIYMTSN